MATFNRYKATSGTVLTANSTDVIIGILVCNTHATQTSECDITLASQDIVKNLRIPVGGSVELVQGKLVAESGDVLAIANVTNNVAVYASVLDSAS
tara:strand:- start:136 stop:423 length:288 start_codon:yes stop_codon:yes gene_type:complete